MNLLLAFRQKLLASLRLGLLKMQLRKISVGKGFYCNLGFYVSRKSRFTAGDNVYVGRHAHVGSNIEIGNNVMIASNVAFVGGDHKIDNLGDTPIRYSGRVHNRSTIIEDNVWIGHGSIIMAGTTIRSGAVVAAGAVVTKDVDSNNIVGGSPAKLIRKRIT